MPKTHYSKPARSFQQQLQQLTTRGLIIENASKAHHLLKSVSYYRLSGYWYPFLVDKQKHLFKPGSRFEDAFRLYCFDRELRSLVISELEKVEIAVRARMIHVLSERSGPFGYLHSSIYKSPKNFRAQLVVKLEEEFIRSDEDFLRAFRKKYTNPLPPAWMAMEIISFGTLSKLYSHLKAGKDKREIANHFGLHESVFESWLHCMVYLRNICAHHSRLWNRTLSIQPQIPRSPRRLFVQISNMRTNRVYFALLIIRYLLQTVNPNTSFVQKLKLIFKKYDNVDSKAMGFPANWDQEVFWQDHHSS